MLSYYHAKIEVSGFKPRKKRGVTTSADKGRKHNYPGERATPKKCAARAGLFLHLFVCKWSMGFLWLATIGDKC